MKTILLTGFSPFDQERINPSYEAVKLIDMPGDVARIFKMEVPTVFGDAIRIVTDAIDRLKPDIIIMVGQAGGLTKIMLERVAINLDDANMPDNSGQQPVDQPIEANGPLAYFSTLPLKPLIKELVAKGHLVGLSNSAGTYVCNHLLYGVLHHLKQHRIPAMAGFVHVPYMDAQVRNRPDVPSMTLTDMVAALSDMIALLVKQ